MNRDVTIIGSGFSGSVLALVLQRMGYHVFLVDRQSHPRFVIGESSTPYADLVLRSLSDRYTLPDLNTLSRYGSWKSRHPHLQGGAKRGFVYFPHIDNQDTSTHRWAGELVVASSQDRFRSDSNWVRSAVDHHLHQACLDSGVECCQGWELESAVRHSGAWRLRYRRPEGNSSTYTTSFLIDATGSGALANRLFGMSNQLAGFRTHSAALFTHLKSLPEWRSILTDHGFSSEHYPFPPDESAMHHLTANGWFWALRFDDGRTSFGQLTDLNEFSAPDKPGSIEEWTQSSLFPDLLKAQLDQATLHSEPGRLVQTGRLQRRLPRAVGPGWIALPSTVGFVDPMHSTGLAWSLHGIEWIAAQFEQGFPDVSTLERYEQNLFRELDAVDLLVSTAYRTRRDPTKFELSAMLYFIATVVTEQNRIQMPSQKQGFLATDNEKLWNQIRLSASELVREPNTHSTHRLRKQWFRTFKSRFQEWNQVGLFDESAKGIYLHTAPEFPQEPVIE